MVVEIKSDNCSITSSSCKDLRIPVMPTVRVGDPLPRYHFQFIMEGVPWKTDSAVISLKIKCRSTFANRQIKVWHTGCQLRQQVSHANKIHFKSVILVPNTSSNKIKCDKYFYRLPAVKKMALKSFSNISFVVYPASRAPK